MKRKLMFANLGRITLLLLVSTFTSRLSTLLAQGTAFTYHVTARTLIANPPSGTSGNRFYRLFKP